MLGELDTELVRTSNGRPSVVSSRWTGSPPTGCGRIWRAAAVKLPVPQMAMKLFRRSMSMAYEFP